MKPGKRYKVKWIDAISFSEWLSADELKKKPSPIVGAVYYYVGSNKDCYIFAAETDGEEYGCSTLVPKGLVKQTQLIA
jgi:hypothetical protein